MKGLHIKLNRENVRQLIKILDKCVFKHTFFDPKERVVWKICFPEALTQLEKAGIFEK